LCDKFVGICDGLKNLEVSGLLQSHIDRRTDIGDVIRRLFGHSGRLSDFLMELSFVSLHFCQLTDRTTKLDISVIAEVLSDASLKVEDEDFVYDYIVRRMSSYSNFFSLLEFVRFDYLSKFSDF
jgi:hypothetical protein